MNIKITKEYVVKNIFIGLERENQDERYIKMRTEYRGIQKYMYLDINTDNDNEVLAFIRVDKHFLDNVKMSEEDAWQYAEKNTFSESRIFAMNNVLPCINNEPFLYILTNKKVIRGAGGLLNQELIRAFGSKHEVKRVLILPSSIHEILLLPLRENRDVNIDEMSKVVQAVNRECVEEREILSNEAYIFNV